MTDERLLHGLVWTLVAQYKHTCGKFGMHLNDEEIQQLGDLFTTLILAFSHEEAANFANLGVRQDTGTGERERLVEQSPSRRAEIASHYRYYIATATTLLDSL
jgi:hypothetical protein